MTDEKDFLPYGRQWIDEDDIAAVSKVLRSGWLTTGPTVEAFEQAFCDQVGARYAVSCSSGTAALHMAALALGLGPGDRVVVPSMTFLATANAVRFTGAEVLFADVDPQTGLMELPQLEACLQAHSGPVKAVFPVHMNGQCVDLQAWQALRRQQDFAVVEDCCHALGGAFTSQGHEYPVGSCQYGDLNTFSFHPVKAVAMGEGGMVTTNDESLFQDLGRLRNHGMTRDAVQFLQAADALDEQGQPNPWYYEMQELGYNYRASDLNCALGLSQLAKLDQFSHRRTELVAQYDAALDSLAPLIRPLPRSPGCRPAWHLYAVHIDFESLEMSRSAFMQALKRRGIGSQVHYFPVHRQPYYAQRYGVKHLPGAEQYYKGILSLPLFAAMTFEDVDRVVDTLHDLIAVG